VYTTYCLVSSVT